MTQAVLLGWGATVQSPISDEAASMVAGLRIWQTGRCDLYRVNPPLVRTLATAPIALSQPAIDWSTYRVSSNFRTEHAIGASYIKRCGPDVLRIFTIARWTCLPVVLFGGWVCYRWATLLYGPAAGIIALVLWCFSPNILAHGQLITTDASAAALGVFAAYAFWRWHGQPTWYSAVTSGFALGIAELTKATWIVAYVIFPSVWAVCFLTRQRSAAARRPSAMRQFVQLALIVVISLSLLNLGYLCKDSFCRLGQFYFVSRALAGEDARHAGGRGGNRFSDTPFAELPVPVPRDYLEGIDWQKYELERELWSYLRGDWRQTGWWYYYLYGLIVKVPIGLWGLAVLAIPIASMPSRLRHGWHGELMLLAPPTLVLLLVSCQTSMNHHVRYVLPALPFVFIWTSKVALALPRLDNSRAPQAGLNCGRPDLAARRTSTMAVVVAGSLAWFVTSCLWVFPHQLAYFNEFAGGPSKGHRHLLGSNLDWGQDQFLLLRWAEAHSDSAPVGLACFTRYFDPSLLRVPQRSVPPVPRRYEELSPSRLQQLGPQSGWYAIRINRLHGRNSKFRYFSRLQPVATAGYSIQIYYLSLDDANRLRKLIGWPKLDQSKPTQPR